MTDHLIKGISQRKAAIIAGLGLLIMTILAIFANFFVFQKLIVPTNPAMTHNNIIASQGIFRIGILSFLTVAILDVIVAWALYILFEPVNRYLALLAAWFRVVYAAIFAIALNNLVGVLSLITTDHSKIFDAGELHAQMMFSLSSFNNGWNIGLAIFGLHLGLIGYLAFQSGYIPKFLGILLIIAGLGYIADSFGKILIPDYNMTIAMFTFIGELLFMIWLLWKGGKVQQQDNPTPANKGT